MERFARAEAGLGGLVWLALLAGPLAGGGLMAAIHRLLALALLVLVPLLLSLVATPDRFGRHPLTFRAAIALHPIAAGAGVGSLLVPTGATAALLAVPWLLFTGLVALFALARLLPRGLACAEETSLDAGLLYLPVGATWLALSRAGASPAGFSEPIVVLTAVHFHYAGFAAPILAGLAGRALLACEPAARSLFAVVAAGVVVGMPLVAAGITASPRLEMAGVLVLATSLVLLAGLVAFRIRPRTVGQAPRTLLLLSASSLALAMVFAAAYGAGELRGAPLVSLPTMVQFHGWANAVGFVLCGGLAWLRLRPPSLARPPGTPFSALASRGRVGPDFFHRMKAVASLERAPRGLVDDLGEYRRGDFDPEEIHPAVRAFYEHTDAHGLLVSAQWRSGFRLAARLYKVLSSRLGQMNLPVSPERRSDLVESAILPIDDELDGRRNVRGWVRRYARSGDAVYVAAYANHSLGPQTYMNIAFPLPGGNVTSILRLEALGSGRAPKGVLLTTLPAPSGLGDEGVYFANRILPLRLPIDETIRVWPREAAETPIEAAGTGDVTVVARHDIWLFGIRLLTLDYAIFPIGTAGCHDGEH